MRKTRRLAMEKKTLGLRMTGVGLAGAMLLFSATVSSGQSIASQQNSSAREKNPSSAFWWSFAGTAVPIAAMAVGAAGGGDLGQIGLAGLLVGPSLGYFYGGLAWRGLLGIGIRGLCAGIILAEGWALAEEFARLILPWNVLGKNRAESGVFLAVGAGVMMFGSAIWDLVSVKGAVNERNLKMRDWAVAFAPLLNLRTRSVGVLVQLSF
jgi:hypothetical protein